MFVKQITRNKDMKQQGFSVCSLYLIFMNSSLSLSPWRHCGGDQSAVYSNLYNTRGDYRLLQISRNCYVGILHYLWGLRLDRTTSARPKTHHQILSLVIHYWPEILYKASLIISTLKYFCQRRGLIEQAKTVSSEHSYLLSVVVVVVLSIVTILGIVKSTLDC